MKHIEITCNSLAECYARLRESDLLYLSDLGHKATDLGYRRVEYKKEVVILQVCIFGDDYMLAEYVFKDDMKDENK